MLFWEMGIPFTHVDTSDSVGGWKAREIRSRGDIRSLGLMGDIQHRHLDYYLDEFTFRFNRRRPHARGLLFHCLA